MHQSGRVAIMLWMRSSPQAGNQLHLPDRGEGLLAQAVPSSRAMNHCSVARKMIGFLQRQQTG